MMNIVNIGRKTLCASLMLAIGTIVSGCDASGPGATKQGGPVSRPLEGARIGGPFTLTDQNGRTVRDTDFNGKYRLVYFGYSFCPDICPVDLQKLMRGLAQFEKSQPALGANIQPLFITVDPARDTPASLKPFVERYHPRLLGLTGTPEQIADVTKKYAMVYNKVEGSAPDRYLMSHLQIAYLMGPDDKPIAMLPVDDPTTPDDEGSPQMVAAELAKWVK